MYTVIRYHDFSAGHRVVGHEGKCVLLHGHNYRVHFHCRASADCFDLDEIGRVIDFSVVKERLCQWLEDNWDHKFLMWVEDTLFLGDGMCSSPGVVPVPFNPTAENMARYLVHTVGPAQLAGTNVELFRCVIEETRKCSATYEKE